MSKLKTFLKGIALGGIVGSVVAFFTAPKKGVELQKDARGFANDMMNEGKRIEKRWKPKVKKAKRAIEKKSKQVIKKAKPILKKIEGVAKSKGVNIDITPYDNKKKKVVKKKIKK